VVSSEAPSISANAPKGANGEDESAHTVTQSPPTTQGSTNAAKTPETAVRFVRDNVDMGITVDCNGGTTLQAIENALKAHGVIYAVDSIVDSKFIVLNDIPDFRWDFYFDNDVLCMFFIFDKTFITPEGFAVDNAISEMKTIYGNGYSILHDNAEPPTTEFIYDGVSFLVYNREDMENALIYMVKYGEWPD
jgi:hypothetical protein